MKKLYKYSYNLKNVIEAYYKSYGVSIRIARVKIIKEFERFVYEVTLLPGTKIDKVFACAKDIKLALKLAMFIPHIKDNFLLIAVSKKGKVEKRLVKILKHTLFTKSKMKIPLAIGYDYLGNMYIADLARLVHLLIAGPSNMGKSVALQCAILSMITRCTVEELRLVLFDIGGNSLGVFESVEHLYHPIVKDYQEGLNVLEAIVAEIDERTLMGEEACKHLPYLVCVIDEFDDTILNIRTEKEKNRFQILIRNIIDRGRKAKVIAVITSLNPSNADSKVNINGIDSRISFKYLKHQNSMNVLGVTGAQNLSGKGSMILLPKDGEQITLQGAYVNKEEIMFLLKNKTKEHGDLPMLKISEHSSDFFENTEIVYDNSANVELAQIVFFTLRNETISSYKIQTTFRVGAKRANGMIDSLYKMGLVGEKYSNQPRKVSPQCIEDLSEEIIGFLEKYGYSREQIEEVFFNKKKYFDEIKYNS